MNKKTLIATALTSAMLASGASAFSDAEGFDTSLGFTGTIVDNEKGWEWRTPEATKTALQNLDAIQSEGVMENNIWSKEFTDDLMLIEGRVNTPFVEGTAPAITVVIQDANGDLVTLISRPEPHVVKLEAQGFDGEISGEIELTIGAGTASAYTYSVDGRDLHVWSQWFRSENTRLAAGVMTSSPAFITHYAGKENASLDDGLGAESSDPYHAIRTAGNLLGAYAAQLQNLKLSFPSHQLPDSWTAQLPVTVTVL